MIIKKYKKNEMKTILFVLKKNQSKLKDEKENEIPTVRICSIFLIMKLTKLYTRKPNRNNTENTDMKPDGIVNIPTVPCFFLNMSRL